MYQPETGLAQLLVPILNLSDLPDVVPWPRPCTIGRAWRQPESKAGAKARANTNMPTKAMKARAPRVSTSRGNGTGNTVRDQIVLDHLPLVKAIAVRVHENLPVHDDLDDQIHAGILGLFDAACKKHPEKQVICGNEQGRFHTEGKRFHLAGGVARLLHVHHHQNPQVVVSGDSAVEQS